MVDAGACLHRRSHGRRHPAQREAGDPACDHGGAEGGDDLVPGHQEASRPPQSHQAGQQVGGVSGQTLASREVRSRPQKRLPWRARFELIYDIRVSLIWGRMPQNGGCDNRFQSRSVGVQLVRGVGGPMVS